jgi:hypothetical protein
MRDPMGPIAQTAYLPHFSSAFAAFPCECRLGRLENRFNGCASGKILMPQRSVIGRGECCIARTHA